MANPWTGEVELTIDGERRALKLTLGALAELESAMGEDSILALVERFETSRFSTRDVLHLIVAGLRGGGWNGNVSDLRTAEISGGPVEAARVAAALLVRAFQLPGGEAS